MLISGAALRAQIQPIPGRDRAGALARHHTHPHTNTHTHTQTHTHTPGRDRAGALARTRALIPDQCVCSPSCQRLTTLRVTLLSLVCVCACVRVCVWLCS